MTPDEVDRFKEYYWRTRRGGRLTLDEAREFKGLAEMASEEKPGDKGLVAVVGIAAFVLAWLSTKYGVGPDLPKEPRKKRSSKRRRSRH